MIPTNIDRKKLRYVAGAFPTGVTIITVEKEFADFQGMTASSFLSVSLDPPLVSFCVQDDASILSLLQVGKIVGISILSASQQAISHQFAGMNKEDIEVSMARKAGAIVVDKALAWYATKIRQIIPAGDHLLFLCEVIDLDRIGEENPLIYWSGYRTVSDVL